MNIGDCFRYIMASLDEWYIIATGRLLIHYEYIGDAKQNFYIEDGIKQWGNPTAFRGIYVLPRLPSLTYFGIDEPDEMAVELPYYHTIKKLGKALKIGDLIVFGGNKWIITDCALDDSYLKDASRIILNVQRYVESVSVAKKVS
jgi:hypothetical protein